MSQSADELRALLEVAELEEQLQAAKDDGATDDGGPDSPYRGLKQRIRDARQRARAYRDGQVLIEDHKGRVRAVNEDDADAFVERQSELAEQRESWINDRERRGQEAAEEAARVAREQIEAADAAVTPSPVDATADPQGEQ